MSKRLEVEIDDSMFEYSEEIESEDYGFIFDSEGNLKFAFVPEFLPDKPPKNIKKIMRILGVIDLQQFNEDLTLH